VHTSNATEPMTKLSRKKHAVAINQQGTITRSSSSLVVTGKPPRRSITACSMLLSVVLNVMAALGAFGWARSSTRQGFRDFGSQPLAAGWVPWGPESRPVVDNTLGGYLDGAAGFPRVTPPAKALAWLGVRLQDHQGFRQLVCYPNSTGASLERLT
jgi:hypothetical protein